MFEKPPEWTKKAPEKHRDNFPVWIVVALAASLVVFSYHWIGIAWVGLLFVDALSVMTGQDTSPSVYGIVGLLTIVAIPVIVIDWGARRLIGRRERAGRRRR